VPTDPRRDRDPQSPILSAVRESQAAVIDVVRAWTDIAQQLTRDLRLPIARIDLAEAVDRVFDVAEQTLAVQRQLALTAAGVATRQVDTAVETVDTAVAAVESTVDERLRRAEREQRDREEPQAPTGDTPKPESPRQNRKFDGRTYEERSIDELRERAGELQLQGRSAMSKDELIAALHQHSK